MFELTLEKEETYKIYVGPQFIGSLVKYDWFVFAPFRETPLPRWMNDEIEVKLWRLNNEHSN